MDVHHYVAHVIRDHLHHADFVVYASRVDFTGAVCEELPVLSRNGIEELGRVVVKLPPISAACKCL